MRGWWMRLRLPTVIGGALAAVIALAVVMLRHAPPATVPPAPRPTATAKPPAVLARVGDVSILSTDLARYEAVKRLAIGVSGERQALGELCDRTLLGLEAKQQGIKLEPAELKEEVDRREIIVGALAPARPPQAEAPGPGPAAFTLPRRAGLRGFARQRPRPPGMDRSPSPFPGSDSVSPWQRANQVLAEAGLSHSDFVHEVAADALAAKVKDKLVYDSIPIARKDVLALWRQRQPSAVRGARRKGAAKAPPQALLAALRRKLQRERGAPELNRLMAQLRRKWKVEIKASPGATSRRQASR